MKTIYHLLSAWGLFAMPIAVTAAAESADVVIRNAARSTKTPAAS